MNTELINHTTHNCLEVAWKATPSKRYWVQFGRVMQENGTFTEWTQLGYQTYAEMLVTITSMNEMKEGK